MIDDFKDHGYNLNHIAQTHSITIANKIDLSYDFYIKHNMYAVDKKLNAMINKNQSLINKFDRNWIHPLNRKFESYHVYLFVLELLYLGKSIFWSWNVSAILKKFNSHFKYFRKTRLILGWFISHNKKIF